MKSHGSLHAGALAHHHIDLSRSWRGNILPYPLKLQSGVLAQLRVWKGNAASVIAIV